MFGGEWNGCDGPGDRMERLFGRDGEDGGSPSPAPVSVKEHVLRKLAARCPPDADLAESAGSVLAACGLFLWFFWGAWSRRRS